MDVQKKLQQVPSSPGIYLMKGARERVIYVGKAKNLKNRLRSYFQNSASLDLRKTQMVKDTKDFDYVVTKNELEALVLEANLIKRTKPRYNIILRDDKNYPYLKVTVNEQWPRIEVTRRFARDGALYFGPYVPAGSMWETLKFMRRFFHLPTCRYNLEKPFRPCIQYQIGRCVAPCRESRRSESDRKKYMEIVKEVRLFLMGEKKEIVSILQKRMLKLSEELRFEEAAGLRDRLKSMERVWETQRVIAPELGDLDVIGLYRKNHEASVFMLFIRNGMVVGQKDFFLTKLQGIEDRELIANFLEQFYTKEMIIPPKILLPVRGAFTTQRQWLREKRGAPVRIYSAKRDKESEVLKMASDNAYYSFCRHTDTRGIRDTEETLRSIQELLNLKKIPKRIEAVDVSNISGSEAVGAVVVWEKGNFIKDDYRLFKIKTVEGIDDFAMIEEVTGRHFKNITERGEKLPQLFLIDGGKGQLESALKAMKPYVLPVEIAAIAKARGGQRDRVFVQGKSGAVPLDPFRPSSHLLQRIRDEVHRFAITYHKKLRTKRTLESPLEKIRGIGKTRRLQLLKKFGSIDAIRRASIAEIASLKGINKKTAVLLKEQLRGAKS
jgi:excinuclease ABC subunit C